MVERLPVPTPFQVGPVNAYLVGRTLVDPGPDSDEAWAALAEGLESRGLAAGDVEQVLITHPHPDHFGSAKRLRDQGARVVASERAAEIVGDFADRLAHEQSYFTPRLARWGISPDGVEATMQLPEAFLPYVEDVHVDRTLAGGETVTADARRLAVGTLRGHAVGELSFAFEDADGTGRSGRTALVGDHVLSDITSNPFLQPPEEPDGHRPHQLARYNESLADLADDGFDCLLPGHGEPIEDPATRIEAILAAHEERTDAVRAALDGPTTPAEVMRELFGDLPATDVFSGMSEALGHLDLLEERGEVESKEHDGVVVYERLLG